MTSKEIIAYGATIVALIGGTYKMFSGTINEIASNVIAAIPDIPNPAVRSVLLFDQFAVNEYKSLVTNRRILITLLFDVSLKSGFTNIKIQLDNSTSGFKTTIVDPYQLVDRYGNLAYDFEFPVKDLLGNNNIIITLTKSDDMTQVISMRIQADNLKSIIEKYIIELSVITSWKEVTTYPDLPELVKSSDLLNGAKFYLSYSPIDSSDKTSYPPNYVIGFGNVPSVNFSGIIYVHLLAGDVFYKIWDCVPNTHSMSDKAFSSFVVRGLSNFLGMIQSKFGIANGFPTTFNFDTLVVDPDLRYPRDVKESVDLRITSSVQTRAVMTELYQFFYTLNIFFARLGLPTTAVKPYKDNYFWCVDSYVNDPSLGTPEFLALNQRANAIRTSELPISLDTFKVHRTPITRNFPVVVPLNFLARKRGLLFPKYSDLIFSVGARKYPGHKFFTKVNITASGLMVSCYITDPGDKDPYLTTSLKPELVFQFSKPNQAGLISTSSQMYKPTLDVLSQNVPLTPNNPSKNLPWDDDPWWRSKRHGAGSRSVIGNQLSPATALPVIDESQYIGVGCPVSNLLHDLSITAWPPVVNIMVTDLNTDNMMMGFNLYKVWFRSDLNSDPISTAGCRYPLFAITNTKFGIINDFCDIIITNAFLKQSINRVDKVNDSLRSFVQFGYDKLIEQIRAIDTDGKPLEIIRFIKLMDDLMTDDRSDVIFDELTPDSNFTISNAVNVRQHLSLFQQRLNGYAQA